MPALRAIFFGLNTSILRPDTFGGGDLILSDSRPIRYTWEGGKERVISMRISDATSISDHIDKAMREEFYLANDIPLPKEITDPLDIRINNKNSELPNQWGRQLFDLQTLTIECEGIQRIWDALTPESIKTGDR